MLGSAIFKECFSHIHARLNRIAMSTVEKAFAVFQMIGRMCDKISPNFKKRVSL